MKNIEPDDVPPQPSGLQLLLTPRGRVRLTGFGGLLLFLVSWRWGNPEMLRWSLPLGAVFSMLGLSLRMWATGWLRKEQGVAVQGPYAFTRNPLYLGTLLLALGHGLMSGVALAVFLVFGLCLALYWRTMQQEEIDLEEFYGDEYRAYRARVPRLVPRLRPQRDVMQNASSAANAFSWTQVRRCYKGFFGNALVIVIYVLLSRSH